MSSDTGPQEQAARETLDLGAFLDRVAAVERLNPRLPIHESYATDVTRLVREVAHLRLMLGVEAPAPVDWAALGLARHSSVSYEIYSDGAFQHGSDDPERLREALAQHPDRYRPGSVVMRVTASEWSTPREFAYDPPLEPESRE